MEIQGILNPATSTKDHERGDSSSAGISQILLSRPANARSSLAFDTGMTMLPEQVGFDHAIPRIWRHRAPRAFR